MVRSAGSVHGAAALVLGDALHVRVVPRRVFALGDRFRARLDALGVRCIIDRIELGKGFGLPFHLLALRVVGFGRAATATNAAAVLAQQPGRGTASFRGRRRDAVHDNAFLRMALLHGGHKNVVR